MAAAIKTNSVYTTLPSIIVIVNSKNLFLFWFNRSIGEGEFQVGGWLGRGAIPFFSVLIREYSSSGQLSATMKQGSLTEGEGSVQLTS